MLTEEEKKALEATSEDLNPRLFNAHYAQIFGLTIVTGAPIVLRTKLGIFTGRLLYGNSDFVYIAEEWDGNGELNPRVMALEMSQVLALHVSIELVSRTDFD
jgi:hypothetical protein